MPRPEFPIGGLAVSGIRLYQRAVSPRKGFRCAHAALHGGESCSAAVVRIIREDGVLGGRRRIAARFGQCRAAHDAIHGGSPLAAGSSLEARGVCCIGPIPIPFRCG
ncbi:membrane protein insertion efficiency factor YidD [Deinococcus hopiensis]|uniref:Haemolytic domain-containing protein n=1 Tax=Deinococcus hopiensis KR-140 TaxID=695939 RepID=A0A1W1VE74_9DEIO|nr:membrane protein insertion efficiency factor YidD [Deinococcus hopiensis]SMB91668.1 Haemolytic domain-containing protein [Deinococcus hopiensis KR-140]